MDDVIAQAIVVSLGLVAITGGLQWLLQGFDYQSPRRRRYRRLGVIGFVLVGSVLGTSEVAPALAAAATGGAESGAAGVVIRTLVVVLVAAPALALRWALASRHHSPAVTRMQESDPP
jgi:hypothetical protein